MQQNDPLHQLYVEHYSYLYRFARSFVNPDLAEDLVQETFLIAQKRLDRVTSSENPTGWLINTLKNVIGNTYQKRQFIYTELSPDAIADEAGEYVHSINDMYAGLIDDEALSLLIWIYCEDTSYQEAANRLGISLDSCKKRIQRAKQALKKAIEKNKLLQCVTFGRYIQIAFMKGGAKECKMIAEPVSPKQYIEKCPTKNCKILSAAKHFRMVRLMSNK